MNNLQSHWYLHQLRRTFNLRSQFREFPDDFIKGALEMSYNDTFFFYNKQRCIQYTKIKNVQIYRFKYFSRQSGKTDFLRELSQNIKLLDNNNKVLFLDAYMRNRDYIANCSISAYFYLFRDKEFQFHKTFTKTRDFYAIVLDNYAIFYKSITIKEEEMVINELINRYMSKHNPRYMIIME